MIDYTPYIPETLSELNDLVVPMIENAPSFKDDTGYFPWRSIDSEFYALVEGFGP